MPPPNSTISVAHSSAASQCAEPLTNPSLPPEKKHLPAMLQNSSTEARLNRFGKLVKRSQNYVLPCSPPMPEALDERPDSAVKIIGWNGSAPPFNESRLLPGGFSPRLGSARAYDRGLQSYAIECLLPRIVAWVRIRFLRA
jgi:hypothetical protein